MSYSTSVPPRTMVAAPFGNLGLAGSGINIWYYSSTADAFATIAGAGYFTNAQTLGMAVGDVVLVKGSSSAVTSHQVTAVTSTGANLSSGTVICTT